MTGEWGLNSIPWTVSRAATLEPIMTMVFAGFDEPCNDFGDAVTQRLATADLGMPRNSKVAVIAYGKPNVLTRRARSKL